MPPPRPVDGSDDEDPLSLSFTSPEPQVEVPSAIPVRSKQKPKQKAPPDELKSARQSSARSTSVASSQTSSVSKKSAPTKSGVKRRQTLDEELRFAVVRDDGSQVDEGQDSGVLVGVGSRSKKLGFMAHGGAGGPPVFMGVGYVDGAGEESSGDDDAHRGTDDDEYQPPPIAKKSGVARSTPVAAAMRKDRR